MNAALLLLFMVVDVVLIVGIGRRNEKGREKVRSRWVEGLPLSPTGVVVSSLMRVLCCVGSNCGYWIAGHFLPIHLFGYCECCGSRGSQRAVRGPWNGGGMTRGNVEGQCLGRCR